MLNHQIRDLSFYFSFIYKQFVRLVFDIHPADLSERSIHIFPFFSSVRPSHIFRGRYPMKYNGVIVELCRILLSWSFSGKCTHICEKYLKETFDTLPFGNIKHVTKEHWISGRLMTSSHASIHGKLPQPWTVNCSSFYEALGWIYPVATFIFINYRLTHSASEPWGFTCTSSLTMNEKFQYRTRLCLERYWIFRVHCLWTRTGKSW